MRTVHTRALTAQRPIIVPSPVLSQVWRNGAKQANLCRVLRGCRVEPTSEPLAKSAGQLLGRSATSDAVDAIVVATALATHAVIVTSDPDDIHRLGEASADGRAPSVIVV